VILSLLLVSAIVQDYATSLCLDKAAVETRESCSETRLGRGLEGLVKILRSRMVISVYPRRGLATSKSKVIQTGALLQFDPYTVEEFPYIFVFNSYLP
jgi:hypothetical protein